MLYDAVLSQQFAAELQKEHIYVTGFAIRLFRKDRHVSVSSCRLLIPVNNSIVQSQPLSKSVKIECHSINFVFTLFQEWLDFGKRCRL